MRILRVAVSDFLSYGDADLDLTDATIVALVGKNGAGKSSLIDAITWGLFGEGRSTTQAKMIREGADECHVRVEFSARGQMCTVLRSASASGRGSTLTLIVDGEARTGHTLPETQKAIIGLIGLDYEAMRAGPIMVQGDSGNFMALKPSPRKDLLVRLFGVDRYDQYADEAKTRAAVYNREAETAADLAEELESIASQSDEATKEYEHARYALYVAKQELANYEGRSATLRERQAAVTEKARHADTLRQTVTMVRKRIESDTAEHARLLKQVSVAHQTTDIEEPTFDEVQVITPELVAKAEQEWRSARKVVDAADHAAVRVKAVSEDLARAHRQVALVGEVPCGGAGKYASCQFLVSVPKPEEIERLKQYLDNLQSTVAGASGVDAERLLRDYTDLMTKRSDSEKELLRRESVVEQWRLRAEQAKQLVSSGQESLRRMETQIARDKTVLERSVKQLADLDVDGNEVDAIEVELRSLKVNIDEQVRTIEMVYQPAERVADDRLKKVIEAKNLLPDAQRRQREAKDKASVYALLAKAFHRDGIPTLILENGIPVIEERANDILDRMPDSYHIRLVTQRERKGGGMMDQMSVIVEANGRERDYENLSGGEKFRIDFALRIALARVLVHRSGGSIDTLIIDEGFGSQDDEGIEAMLESLAAVQEEFGLVLVVTHQSQVIQRLPRVEVTREDGLSTAVRI